MATEGDRDPLVDGVSQANVSREELRDMLRAAVREPPPTSPHRYVLSQPSLSKPWSPTYCYNNWHSRYSNVDEKLIL